MILLPYKIFCYLTSEAFKNQLTLKTPEATSSASIKERKHFRIRNQERKLSPANILNEPAQTSRFRPQRPVRRSFPCLFTHPIKLEESSRARSRLFYTLPETNPRLRPCSPNRAEDAQLLDPPACLSARPPARRRRGCRRPGRSSLPTSASPLPSPLPHSAAVAGGRPGRAPRTHRARGEREPHRSAGPLNDSAASAPCAPPSWEPGQAARCVITLQRRSARGRRPRQ